MRGLSVTAVAALLLAAATGTTFNFTVDNFSGNLMRKILVPMVGTECDTFVTEPVVCKLVNKCVLPDCFGPKHKQEISLLTDIIQAQMHAYRLHVDSFNLVCLLLDQFVRRIMVLL